MLPIRVLVLAILLGILAGCQGDGYPANPPGEGADKKDFTKDDARNAQPARKGSEGE